MKDSFSILLGFRFVAPHRAASRETLRSRISRHCCVVTAKMFFALNINKTQRRMKERREREKFNRIHLARLHKWIVALHKLFFCTNNTQCNEDRSRKREFPRPGSCLTNSMRIGEQKFHLCFPEYIYIYNIYVHKI